jgi:hypothetical protein
MRSSGLASALNPVTDIFVREKRNHERARYTQGDDGQVKTQGETGVLLPQAKECLGSSQV